MFPGFALDDFDSYVPERATSNMFNRQRLAVKEKLLEITRAAADAVRAACPDLEPAASDHAPTLRNGKRVESQWSFFWRGPELRAGVAEVIEGSRGLGDLLADPPPWWRHAVLAATVTPDGFAVGLRISAQALVDAANLRALLADSEARDRLLAALRALPESFALAVPGAASVPAPAVTPATLEAFLAAFPEGGTAWFDVGRTWPKPEAAAAGSGLLRRAAEDLERLAPLYRCAAWTPDNDHVGFDRLLERVRLERAHEEEEHDDAQRAFSERRAGSQAAARERLERMFADRGPAITRGATREIPASPLPAWAPVGRRRREEPGERSTEKPAAREVPAAPEEARSSVEARAAAGGRETSGRSAGARHPRPAAEPPRPRERESTAAPQQRPGRPGPGSAPPTGRAASLEHGGGAAETGGIAPGSLVRFRDGSLRGRVGTLFEVSARGEARVMLGLFTTRVPVEQLAEVRRRTGSS